MRILDLFAGLGGEQRRAMVEGRGHTYTTLDLNPAFNCDITKDIFEVTVEDLKGHYDFIWASFPCEAFSVASIGHHWSGDSKHKQPKTDLAILSQRLVEHTRHLLENSEAPLGWLMENPRGVCRKLPCVAGLPRVTVTYCQYGDTRMKPTDLWGSAKGWVPRPMCKNGDPCHPAAPRGSRTGTQGLKGAAERSVVPIGLWEDLLTALEQNTCG